VHALNHPRILGLVKRWAGEAREALKKPCHGVHGQQDVNKDCAFLRKGEKKLKYRE